MMKTQEKTNKVKSVLTKTLASIILVVFVVLAAMAVEKSDSIMQLFADKTTESEATNEGGETSRSSYQMSYSYSYTGNYQTFIAPVTGTYKLEVWGAQGGGSNTSGNGNSGLGGNGGYSTGDINLKEGESLYIYVGGRGKSSTNGSAAGGYNGGGSGYASSEGEPGNGGGGATDIRVNGKNLYNRVIVAGGGGGGRRRYRRCIWTWWRNYRS